MINSFSIVIPSYNESGNINKIYRRTLEVIKKLNLKRYEIIFIENGSKDNSLDLLKKINLENKSVKIISFSRNFGFQAAISAGLKYAENDYVCVMVMFMFMFMFHVYGHVHVSCLCLCSCSCSCLCLCLC